MWDGRYCFLYFTTLKDNTFLLLSTQEPFSQQKNNHFHNAFDIVYPCVQWVKSNGRQSGLITVTVPAAGCSIMGFCQ